MKDLKSLVTDTNQFIKLYYVEDEISDTLPNIIMVEVVKCLFQKMFLYVCLVRKNCKKGDREKKMQNMS